MKDCPYCIGYCTTAGFHHDTNCPRHPSNSSTVSICTCHDYKALEKRIEKLENELKELKSKVLYNDGPDYGQPVCKDCGAPIEYTGEFWKHIGAQPRHMAKPKYPFNK